MQRRRNKNRTNWQEENWLCLHPFSSSNREAHPTLPLSRERHRTLSHVRGWLSPLSSWVNPHDVRGADHCPSFQRRQQWEAWVTQHALNLLCTEILYLRSHWLCELVEFCYLSNLSFLVSKMSLINLVPELLWRSEITHTNNTCKVQ